MRTIEVSKIIIDKDRVRSKLDSTALFDLMESIASPKGLLHAPVLREVPEGLKLVAGENRITAIRRLAAGGRGVVYDQVTLPPGVTPYVLLGVDLTEDEYLAAELEENLRRSNLTWQDQVKAEARLHALLSGRNLKQTVADTARVIKQDTPTPDEVFHLHTHIKLVDHLDDPDVAKAKDAKSAVKIARAKVEHTFRQEMAERLTDTARDHQLYFGKCQDILPVLEKNSVRCMIVDPPYGINAQTFDVQGTNAVVVQHEYDDSKENALAIVHALATAECMKLSSHIWCFCDVRMFNDFAAVFRAADWYVWPFPVVWDRQGLSSMVGNVNGPKHGYDMILFAQRGGHKVTRVFNDILHVRGVVDKIHAAQKPVELYKILMTISAMPGETVLDACCGSGTIFQAAEELRCHAIGIEASKESYNLAKTTLHGVQTCQPSSTDSQPLTQ